MKGLLILCISATLGLGHGWAFDAPEAYVNGIKMAKEGKYREALALLQQVAKDHPHYPGLRYNMGNLLFRMGEYWEASKEYKEAVRDDPADADAFYNLAMTYSMLDEMEKALDALQQVVRIRPGDGEAHYRLASGYFSLRSWRKASFHIDKAKAAGYPVPRELEDAVKANLPPPSKGEKVRNP